MGFLRFNELALNDVADEDSYKKYDLSEAGKLTALILKVGEQNGENLPAPEGHIEDHITKIEVIGKRDKTIKSLRGLDLQGINAYRTGRMPPSRMRRADTRYSYEEFIIMFGRHIGDPLLYLDLGKDPDIDLKVTNDFGTTYWEDGQLKYTLHELFLPDATPPEKGYIRSYEHSYWASVSGERENKKLTPGFKVFDVWLRGAVDRNATTGLNATDPYQVLREISVDFLNAKEKIIDAIELRDLQLILGQMYGGPWTRAGQTYADGDDYYPEGFIGYPDAHIITLNENASASSYIGTHEPDAGPILVHTDSALDLPFLAHGWLPYNGIMLPFDIGWPGMPLLDTEAKKPVYIRVKSNTSSGDVYLCVEELGAL